MDKLVLKITGDKTLQMEIDNASKEAKDMAVARAFELFLGQQEVAATAQVEKPEATVQKKLVVREEPKKEENQLPPGMTYQRPPQPVYKNTHMQNDTSKYGQAKDMDEAAKASNDQPDWYKTGIKFKNNKPHYKTRYKCPKCSTHSNHYIPIGVGQVDCHNCQTTMQVRKAVTGTAMERDKLGNYYVAGDQEPAVDVLWQNQTHKRRIIEIKN